MNLLFVNTSLDSPAAAIADLLFGQVNSADLTDFLSCIIQSGRLPQAMKMLLSLA